MLFPLSFVTLSRNGSVALSVDGVSWLQSDEILLRATSDSPLSSSSLFTTLDGSLNLVNFSTDHQEADALGAYNATRWSWAANVNLCGGGIVFQTEARVYADSSKVVFKQSFPCKLTTSTKADNWLVSEFPSFRSAAKNRGFDRFMTFNDPFARGRVGRPTQFNSCSVKTQGGVPIVLFQSKGQRIGSTLVFSQLTKMKTGEMYCGMPKSSLHEKKSAGKKSCRIVTQKTFNLLANKDGYNAYVPDSTTDSDRNYTKHYHNYCNDSHVWAYTGNDDMPSCQQRCDEMNCTCFDAFDHDPPTPPPTPPTPTPDGAGALALGLKVRVGKHRTCATACMQTYSTHACMSYVHSQTCTGDAHIHTGRVRGRIRECD